MADNPYLTARLHEGKNPTRILLTRTLDLSSDLNLFSSDAKTIVFNSVKSEELDNISFVKIDWNNKVLAILNYCYQHAISSIIIEGGTNTIYNFMNCNMWENPIIQENLSKLEQIGYNICNPEEGFLACGYNGNGRLCSVDKIFDKSVEILNSKKKLLNKNEFEFCINTNLNLVLENIEKSHKTNWLTSKYKDLILSLQNYIHPTIDFKIFSIELYDKNTKELISGEIGYKINSTYTSLTGFSSTNKKYNNWGKLQLVLLGKYLEKENFSFWNLGHPYMQYKFDLGAITYKRKDFLKRWLAEVLKID
jgi:hypothetical protein